MLPSMPRSCLLSRCSSFLRTSIQLQHARRGAWTTTKTARRPPLTPIKRNAPKLAIISTTPEPLRLQRAANLPNRNSSTIPAPSSLSTSLPPYLPPTSGLLSHLPASWVPYAELIRLDKPTGTYLLFFPCLFSTLLAAPLTTPIAPPLTVLGTSALFFAGALIMRGAGCTINDLWDRNLDPHVARTRLRPIARGAIRVRQALPFLGFQLLAGLGILLRLPPQCLYYAIPSLLLVATYPLAKRVTNYPQFVLGLTFSWGAVMGFPALGIDLLSHTYALVSAGCLYASCVAWTIIYDMIYAYQDIRDDAAAGIKSIALARQSNAKTFLALVAAAQVTLLAGAGLAVGAGPCFFLGTCGGAAGTLGYMIRRVNLEDVGDCWRWFKKGAWLTGGAVSVGLGAEYLVRWVSLYRKGEKEGVMCES